MKVKELQKIDGDRIVILQKDIEGSGYSPLEYMDDEVAYRADSTWSGFGDGGMVLANGGDVSGNININLKTGQPEDYKAICELLNI